MRKKIGTLLDERLVKRAQGRAAQEGKAFNDLLEAALEAYLARHSVVSGQRLVDESWGAFRVSRRQLAEALKADPLDA
jgi:molybdenum-dependent DNA-binding transcriptional regulator ModE